MRIIKFMLLMLALMLSVGMRGQYNPTNPAEPGAYTLTLKSIPTDAGSFNMSVATSHYSGENVTVRAYDSGNYKFVRWEDDKETVVSSSAQFVYTMPSRNAVLVARYEYNPSNPSEPSEPVTYSKVYLESSPSDGGYFNISSGSKYEVGASVNIRAYYNSNFVFKNWTEDGEVVSTSSSFNYVVKDHDTKLVANFEYSPSNPSEPTVPQLPHKLTLQSNPSEGGYFNTSSGTTYVAGTNVYLRAYPNTYYSFKNWTLGGEVISTSNTFTYTMPDNDVTLVANYDYNYNPSNPGEPAAPTADNHLYGMRMNVTAGQSFFYPVYMENKSGVTGYSIDIAFPQGFAVDAQNSLLTMRASGHVLDVQELGDNAYRFFIRGTETFKGVNGKVLEVPVVVPDTVTVGNVFTIGLSKGVVFMSDGSQNPVTVRNGSLKVQLAPDELPDSPDFVVTDIRTTAQDVVPGDVLHISWKVGNDGNLDATGGWSERVSLVSENGKKITLGTFYYDTEALVVGGSVSREADVALSSLPGIEGKVKISVTVIPYSYSGEATEFQKNNTSETADYVLTVGKTLYLTMPEAAIVEGETTVVRCQLSRSGSWTDTETFALELLKGDDRLQLPATVTIPRDQSGVYFYLNIADNDVLDADDEFEISASGNGYDAVAGKLTIEDDEYPQLVVTPSKTDITEGETFSLTIELQRASASPVDVSITTDFPKRFSFPATVTVPAGETSTTVEVTAVDNDNVELQESVAFKVSAEKYQSSECIVLLDDNDLPAIELELSPTTVSEAAGPTAIFATLRRLTNTDKKVTILLSDDSNGDIYYSRKSFELEKGVEEVQFSLGVVDNAIVDGDRMVNITAAVYVSSCNCSALGSSAGSVTKTIEIIDNDGPSLGVASSNSTLVEGGEIVLTITRNTNTDKAVGVTISSDGDEGLEYEHNVTIPAGAKSVDVVVKAVPNAASGDDRTIVFTIESEGFSKGTCWVMLTDQTLPDAVISAISVSTQEVEVGGSTDVSVTVGNIGAAELPEVTKVGIYLSNSSTPIATLYTQNVLAAGGQTVLSKTVTLPQAIGTYDVYAVINEGRAVKELLYVNNTSERVSVKTVAPFRASVSTDKTIYGQGEDVVISGTVAGNGTAGADVEVYVINEGLRQTFKTTADGEGKFSLVYKPYASQMGHFSVGACYSGENIKTEMAAFDIYGFKRVSASAITCEAIVGEPYEGSVSFVNPGQLSLTGVKSSILSKPEHCDVTISCPETIEGGQTVGLKYSIVSATASEGNNWEEIKLLIETAEGPSVETTLYYYCRNAKGQLQTNVSSITTTMVKGASRDYPIVITNIGKGETGKITLALPDWMSAATPLEMASLAHGESVTAVLRFTPTEAMQLNVPVTGTIGINCENGSGLALRYSIEPVSESVGTLVVDVCDEYTYYTAEAPHVAGAQVLVKHPTTGAIVAQGITGENGIYSVELPEGYYSISVTADNHDSYKNNVLVDPGTVTKEVVNLSFRAISVDWKVEETEVEDEYNIVTTVKYETNVPMPVVDINIPAKIAADELQPGESLIFYATLTNKGLITAQDVELELPTGLKTLVFEALDYNDGTLDIAPQQSVVIPVRVTKVTGAAGARSKAKNMDDDPCASQVGTLYFWDCGNDRKWHRYDVALQLGSCKSDDPSTWGNNGEGTYGGGTYGGGSGGGGFIVGPNSGIGGGGGTYGPSTNTNNPITTEDKGCEPCQNGILIAGAKCIGHFIGDALDTLESLMSSEDDPSASDQVNGVYDLLEQIASTFDSCVNGVSDFDSAYKCYKSASDLVDQLFDDAVTAAFGNFIPASKMAKYKSIGKKMLKWKRWIDIAADCANDFVHACDHLNEDNDETDAGQKSKYRSNSQDYIKSVLGELEVVQTRLVAFSNVNNIMWGSEKEWEDVSFDEMCSLMDSIDYKSDSFEDVIKYKPESLSREQYRQFFERRKQYLMDGMPEDVAAEFSNSIRVMQETHKHFADMGYSVPSDYTKEHVKGMWEQLNEGKSSVCASISLQLSQTMTMTRQAFRGTLTVFNGHEDTAMENVRLNLEVRDDEGTLATSHEFQINPESLKGFTGNLDLTSGWSLAANETGTATIVFIPTKYAALESDRDYSFGGSLTYVDPFTGLEVTRDLYPVTLTVKPSPNLDLTYFMQRDIYGDNPLTADIIEPCEPAEFALVINNKGYGDATNVRMMTDQPKIVDNEKGLLIDFELLSSQLNGGDKTLALGGSVATDFGTIPAQSAAYAQWWLQSSLLGHFTDYDIKATHVTSYGNEDLSLLDNVTIHELIHGFTIDDKTDPALRGFLVNDIVDAEDMPDMLYFSNGSQEEAVQSAASVTMARRSDTEYTVTIIPSAEGWTYGTVADQTGGSRKLVSVVRTSDGAQMPVDNFWLTAYRMIDGKEPVNEHRLHAVARLTGAETYVLTFENRPETELEVETFTGVPADGEVLTTQLKSVNVVFNKPIDEATFTTDDISLACQGEPVDVSQMVITKSGDTAFTLDMSSVTLKNGYYVLTVQTAAITDSEGFTGRNGKNTSWTQFVDGKVVLAVKAEPEEGGTVSPATGLVDYNTAVTLKAVAAEGYDFGGWKHGDETVSEEPEFGYTMTADEEFTAVFNVKYYDVVIDSDPLCGAVSVATGKYAYGTVLELRAAAADGYRFDGWMVGDETVSTSASYDMKVTGAVTVKAVFSKVETGGEKIPYDVNGDGRLDVNDIVTLSKYVSDGDASVIMIDNVDLTGDGRVTVADIVELARKIANQ